MKTATLTQRATINVHIWHTSKSLKHSICSIIPDGGFEAVGDGLCGFDKEHFGAVRGLVAGGSQVGEAGGLEAWPLQGAEFGFDQKAGCGFEDIVVHGLVLVCWLGVGESWLVWCD
jgi:hypothetical protein